MPAGDVFGLDGIFLNKSNPITVSVVDINPASSSAGIAITGGSFSSGTITLNLSNAAGLFTTPFYTGAIIGVSSISQAGVALTGYNGTFVVTGFAGTTTVSYATTGYVGPVAASIGATTIGYVQLLTDGNVTNTTWSSAQTHGWFGGGFVPGGVPAPRTSTVNRIDFSNDSITASIRGSLSDAKNVLAATGNSNYGWFGGGYLAGSVSISTVDRIDFSNDSPTVSVRGSLSTRRQELAAIGNSNYGWFGGGYAPSTPSIRASSVDRIDFSNDSSTASPRGPLSLARNALGATGNSNYGWFGGGRQPGPATASTVDRIDFSNDSATASVRGPLSSTRNNLGATGNSNYGWFGGGYAPSRASSVDRIDFSNDLARASIRGPLSLARENLAATGNSNYGWFGGGRDSLSNNVSISDRIDFSNDLATSSFRGFQAVESRSNSATSGQAKGPAIKLAKTLGYGWFGGGTNPSFVTSVSIVSRIDFSNDSMLASTKSPLSSARYSLSATGNSNYGWFIGGSVTRTVDRINFSNDLTAVAVRGSMSATRYRRHAATGNSNYGWIGGGFNGPTSSIDRIDFSNDLPGATPRGSLTSVRDSLAATGNSNYGWFGGGFNGPPTTAAVDRIDFSNDSITASVRGPLSAARAYLAATGNSNYGWFSNATAPGPLDRINFSNDSVTAQSRGPLSAARSYLAAAGNSNYGWFGGGFVPSPGFITATVDRIDFSNDLATASPRGGLNPGLYRLAATSNTTFS